MGEKIAVTEGIIIALITGGLAVIGNLIVQITANSKTVYRIDQLEKKMDKHNNLVERLCIVERDLKTAFNRVDFLRADVEKNEQHLEEHIIKGDK